MDFFFQGPLGPLRHPPEQLPIPLNKSSYHRPRNFDYNSWNSFQIRDKNHSLKPNNKGKAEPRPRAPIIRPPKEKRRNNEEIDFPGFDVFDLPNNRKFNSDVYQDDPPPLIRPPSPGSRRNPEVKFRYSEKATKFEKIFHLKKFGITK